MKLPFTMLSPIFPMAFGPLACFVCLTGCQSVSPTTSTKNIPVRTVRIPKEKLLPSNLALQAKGQIERDVTRKVPFGSNRAFVERWLKSQNLEVQFIKQETLNRDDYKAVITRNGHRAADLGSLIVSFKRIVIQKKTFFAALVFFFNTKGTLIDFSIE